MQVKIADGTCHLCGRYSPSPCDWIMGASAAEEGLTGMTKQHGTGRD